MSSTFQQVFNYVLILANTAIDIPFPIVSNPVHEPSNYPRP